MWLGLGCGLGFMMPLKTWPVARRQQSGMMGLLVERSSSNCTTVAAYARAFGSARRASSVRIGCRARVRVRLGLGLGLRLGLALTLTLALTLHLSLACSATGVRKASSIT